jgi:hypothetical protein
VSPGDWIAFAFLAPLMLAVGWVQTFRVWRRKADVSAGVSSFTGKSSVAGYDSFLLPAAVAFTLVWLAIVLDEAAGSVGVVSATTSWLAGLGLLFLIVSFWMWLFAWPRFLVPPHLRGEPGWVVGLSREWRTHRRERRDARVYAGRRGGNRAAR